MIFLFFYQKYVDYIVILRLHQKISYYKEKNLCFCFLFSVMYLINRQKWSHFLIDDLLAFWKSNDFLSIIDEPNNRWIRKFIRENGNNLPEKKVDQICKCINITKASEIQSIYTDFLSYMFRCSLMTVHRAQKRENDEKNHIEGRKRILSSEENEEIINWISKKTKILCPPDRNELTQKAHVTHYILSSWKKAGIVPILEFGAINILYT